MSEQLIKTPSVFGENGNFLLEREIGAGGMGGVYMGRDKMLDRPVAVKVMLKELGSDAEFVERFKKEAQSVARLIHPNIAQVYSYGICDGMPYIAMELASGGSLYSIMTSNPGKADIARVIKICQQVAQALQCASDQGCVHGDVKPENILLDASGNAKLVDFGLAAMQKDTDEIWGTPYYISPEKVKKEPIDFRADMYCLGGTLYHALTGVAPFEGDDAVEVVKKRFEGMPKKPSEIRPEITDEIDALVMKMLALEKEDRFPTFEALLEAFKNVLTSGLSKKEGASESAPKTSTGVKKMSPVRGRRITTMKRAGATSIKKKLEGEEGNEGSVDETEETVNDEEEDEEAGAHLGLKVLGVILGVILLIGGVVGGLIWYQIADKNARAAEEQQQITAGMEKARGAIRDTVAQSIKFADEFDVFAKKAEEACQKSTDELKKILPAEQGTMLKPTTSKELQDAIAATNEVVSVVAEAAASTNATNTVVTTSNAVNQASAPVSNAAPAKVEKSATANPPSAATTANNEPAKDVKTSAEQMPQVVITMNELWERAYGCLASAVRIRHAVRQIVKKAAEADEIKDNTRENVEKLAELSRTLVDMLDQIKTSKDVENVRKGITFIKTKGEKTVEQTVKRLRIEKLEADRKAKAEAAAAKEKERRERIEAEKKAKVEEESKAAQDKFEMIAAQGCFRQLDWKSATRQLETLKAEFVTAEGQLAADLELRKVTSMKKVQDVMLKSMRGFAFKKSKLKGAKVTSVSVNDIQMERGKGKLKITWQKFYKEYYSNLIEAMNYFIFNGRKNAGLNQRDVAEALTGASLTLSIVCAEEATAVTLAEKLALEAVKQFPDYVKTAQKIFPDLADKFKTEEE